MMTKNIVAAIAMLLLIAPIVPAQSTTNSLEQVWEKVLKNYPSIKSRNESLEASVLKKKLVKQDYLPDIAFQSQHSIGSAQNIPGSFFPLPGMININGSKTAADAASVNLFSSALMQWNFLQFGLQNKRSALADAAIKSNQSLVKQEELKLLSEASRMYFTALSDAALLKITRADATRLSDLLDLLKSQSDAGLKPGADTLLLKSSLLQAASKAHHHQSKLNAALIELSALTGDNNALQTIDTTLFYRFNRQFIGSEEAIKDHPYLQVMQQDIQYEMAAKEVIRREQYPTVSLLAGLGVKGSELQKTAGTYLAGIGLTWNFSSLYQNKTKRAVADRIISSARAEKDALQTRLKAQYAAAAATWNDQQEKLRTSFASMNSSREAYELYKVRYESGLISLIELLQLQKNLQEAESNYAEAIAGYWNELLTQAEQSGNPYLILRAIKP